MALCPAGSTVKAGSPAYQWITWLDAQAWLGNVFAKFNWIAYLVPPFLVDVGNFCATEPTQPVAPSEATIVAAARDPVAFETLIQYIKDSALWWVWSQLCECNASGSPACLTQMWPHASNPSTAVYQANKFESADVSCSSGGYTIWGIDVCAERSISQRIFWFDVPTTITHFETVAMVAGWQRFYFSTPCAMTVNQIYRVGISSIDGSTYASWYGVPSHSVGLSSPLTFWGFKYGPANFGTATPETYDVGIDPLICVGSPAAYSPSPPPVPTTSIPNMPAPTCSTATDLCELLNPALYQISLLKQRLDLLQRRMLPFAWIAGSTSTGLTGNGVIAVQDALGCIVALTTVPGGWGQTYETPRRLIPSAGSIQGTDGTNYDDNRQVHYEHEVMLTETPWATGIKYNFGAGIVASITPIYPEP